ncbi:MAG: hypothetical protein PHD81_03430 [Candidatus Nanoarchaeia archaeon]|nr:hypothetical protein [Candidatus Nanoarchaeia archaeon]MDD5588136.1 hypothetical protein [Candidatus Nanoarchaeia archaeon]
MDKIEIEVVSWVLRGRQRKIILKILDKPKTPTQIKEETRLSLNNVSDVLRLFVKNKIAKCLNEEAKTGRIYELTSLGKNIKEKIN